MERQHEQHASIRCGRHQQPQTSRTEVLLEHKVAATAGEHARGCLWIGQLADRISLDSGGIDDHASGPALLHPRVGFADGSAQTPIR